ncbi:dentin sialophosphoprotein isoform X2 [Dermacentor silvarum]|nr:dentin sialophosphoprotein isoform X2 [Dermacentor silvarum]XP_049512365.1 dentin sialophosphoprotein isoform X2 [Dermacentor silvarum]
MVPPPLDASAQFVLSDLLPHEELAAEMEDFRLVSEVTAPRRASATSSAPATSREPTRNADSTVIKKSETSGSMTKVPSPQRASANRHQYGVTADSTDDSESEDSDTTPRPFKSAARPSSGGNSKPSGSSGGNSKPSGSSGGNSKPSGSSGGNSKTSGSSGGNSKTSGSSGGNFKTSGSSSGNSTAPDEPHHSTTKEKLKTAGIVLGVGAATISTHDDLPGSDSEGSHCCTKNRGVEVLMTVPAGVESPPIDAKEASNTRPTPRDSLASPSGNRASPVATSAPTLHATEGRIEADSSTRNDASVLGASQEGQTSSSEDIAALRKRISELEDRLQSARRRLSLAQRGKNQVIQKYERLKKQVGHFLAPDQLDGMGKSSMRGTKWTDGTIRKALKVRLSCGSRGYNVVKEIIAPLPTERTLQRHLEHLRSSPGALHELMRSLSDEVNHVEDSEGHTALMDDVQLMPGVPLDLTTGAILGIPTVPLADTPR